MSDERVTQQQYSSHPVLKRGYCHAASHFGTHVEAPDCVDFVVDTRILPNQPKTISGQLEDARTARETLAWGRCHNYGGGHVGSHARRDDCVSWIQDTPTTHRFEQPPFPRHRFTYEEAFAAIYELYGDGLESAPDILRYVKKMKDRIRELEEANDILRVQSDSAYRRGREEAAREFRRKVAELMLCGERE